MNKFEPYELIVISGREYVALCHEEASVFPADAVREYADSHDMRVAEVLKLLDTSSSQQGRDPGVVQKLEKKFRGESKR